MSLDLTLTGVEVVDNLLYAIETASTHMNNSTHWDEPCCGGEHYGLVGSTPEEWISNAALDVAKALHPEKF